MAAKTVRIVPSGEAWIVKEPGGAARPAAYTTQKQAVSAARKAAKKMVDRSRSGRRSGEVVLLDRDGSIRWREIHGLPKIQKSPSRSDLGTKAIREAVSAVIRERSAGKTKRALRNAR